MGQQGKLFSEAKDSVVINGLVLEATGMQGTTKSGKSYSFCSITYTSKMYPYTDERKTGYQIVTAMVDYENFEKLKGRVPCLCVLECELSDITIGGRSSMSLNVLKLAFLEEYSFVSSEDAMLIGDAKAARDGQIEFSKLAKEKK